MTIRVTGTIVPLGDFPVCRVANVDGAASTDCVDAAVATIPAGATGATGATGSSGASPGWTDWTTSDQSSTGTGYIEAPLPDLINTYIYELELDLKGATRQGWYTRYRIVVQGDPETIGSDTSSAIYSRSGTQYTGATYTVATVGSDHFLRFQLGSLYETLTTRILRWRLRQM